MQHFTHLIVKTFQHTTLLHATIPSNIPLHTSLLCHTVSWWEKTRS